MKRTLALLFFIFSVTGLFAKGRAGSYFVKGTAYGINKTLLKNCELSVTTGGKTQIVTTDSAGQFEIEVAWATACPSGISAAKQRRETKRHNPKYIYIKYKDKELKLNNDWKKYAQRFPETKEAVTKKQDLSFV
ncbi:MAG: hypothetical protein JWP12_146 [Bacteroidetes bacterium]|nr:hypothetical protein [Bacteroidota bacterium]